MKNNVIGRRTLDTPGRCPIRAALALLFLFSLSGFFARSDSKYGKKLVSKNYIVDTQEPLSELRGIEMIGKDSMLILDTSSRLRLFVKGRYVRTVGKGGRGPEEYVSPTSACTDEGKMFIFDQRLGKVVWYNLSNNEFLGEIVKPEFTQFESYKRINGQSYFFVTRYVSSDSANRGLLFRLDRNGNLTDVGIKFSMLGIGGFRFPVRAQPAIGWKETKLFICYPFSSRLIVYDLQKQTAAIIDLRLPHVFRKEHQ